MRIAATTVFIMAVGIGPVFAKGGPPSKPAGSRPPKVAHAGGAMTPKAGTHGAPKTTRTSGAPKAVGTHAGPARGGASVKTTKGSPTHGKAPAKTTAKTTRGSSSHVKATSTRGAASTKGSDRTMKATGKSAKTLQSTTTGTSTSPTTTTATSSETPVLGPNVPRNPKLQAKLLAMLPAGMTINDAAAGFKNQGQFVAAVHVSNNLGLPFTQLKTRMVDDGLSLGQAIQAVKPTADSNAAARIGEQQAAADLQ